MRPLWHNWKALLPYLLAALIESATIMPWLMLIYSNGDAATWTMGLPGAWLPVLTYLAAAAWESGSPKQEAEASGRSRMLAMAAGLAGTYLLAYAALPPAMRPSHPFRPNLALAYIPVGAYLWYMGVRAAAERLDYYRVYGHFLWQAAGLVVGVVFLAIAGIARDPRIALTLAWSVILLFAGGLMLLVMTREQHLRQGQKAIGQETGGGPRLSEWLAGGVAGLTGLTLLVSQALSLDRLTAWSRAVLGWMDRPFSWLVDVFMLLFYRMLLLVWLVIGPAYNWILAHRKPLPPQEAQNGLPPSLADQLKDQPGVNFERYLPFVKGAMLFLAVAVAAVLLYRRFASLPQMEADEEERINLGFWSNLLADEKALLRRFRRRSRFVAGTGETSPADALDPRLLFRRLQAYGAEVGRPRRRSETPNAFRNGLSRVREQASTAAAAVTDVYNQARYGEIPPPPAAVAEAAAKLDLLVAGAQSESTDHDR